MTIDVTEANQNVIYVADIRFRIGTIWWWTRRTAIFEIRMDSNGDGQGGGADDVAAGVAITVEFNGNSYSGVTQSDGTFRVGVWASNASAEVVDLRWPTISGIHCWICRVIPTVMGCLTQPFSSVVRLPVSQRLLSFQETCGWRLDNVHYINAPTAASAASKRAA